MNKLFEFLQEANGDYSSMRVFTFVSIACMAVDWMYATFHGGRYSPDPSLVALILGPITAKVVQKKFEEKTPPPSSPSEGGQVSPAGGGLPSKEAIGGAGGGNPK